MALQEAIQPFLAAHSSKSPKGVASFLSPAPEDPLRLYNFWRTSNEVTVLADVKNALQNGMPTRTTFDEGQGWVDIISCYWRAVDRILKAEQAENQGKSSEKFAADVYDTWKDLTLNFIKYITNGSLPYWTVFTVYHVADHLRKFAVIADKQAAKFKPAFGADNAGVPEEIVTTGARMKKLEDVCQVLNKIFNLCQSDRNPDINTSRKWGVYSIANLQFKAYFKLKAISLSKNVVRSIDAQKELPPFEQFPKADRVTYKYYVGVLSFLQEDYTKADAHLTEAWETCHPIMVRNKERILTYLVPCRLITQHKIPSAKFLNEFPRIRDLFGDLVGAIVKGDLSGFDKALAEGEPEFVRRRVFLTLERSRDIALRNLLRKVFLAEGYEELKEGQTALDRVRKSRVPISHFATALRMGTAGAGSGQALDDDEVECLLANMIYKGLMKGYISRDHGMVVLNKKGAFPGTRI